jgi:hypothetical protein
MAWSACLTGPCPAHPSTLPTPREDNRPLPRRPVNCRQSLRPDEADYPRHGAIPFRDAGAGRDSLRQRGEGGRIVIFLVLPLWRHRNIPNEQAPPPHVNSGGAAPPALGEEDAARCHLASVTVVKPGGAAPHLASSRRRPGSRDRPALEDICPKWARRKELSLLFRVMSPKSPPGAPRRNLIPAARSDELRAALVGDLDGVCLVAGKAGRERFRAVTGQSHRRRDFTRRRIVNPDPPHVAIPL